MRKLIVGVDANGRSCVVESGEVEVVPVPESPGFAAALVGATTASPPPMRPPGAGPTNDLGVGPGLVTWMIVDYAPNLEFPVHNTDTIDFDTVLDGTITIVLDDGEHELHPGDVLVVNGVDHGWKAGPDGCRLSILMLGTPPRA